MLTLGIHTAGRACLTGLARGETLLAAAGEPIARGHEERLPALVDAALKEARKTIADITQVAVCTGPGSFTGIRVGVAYARALGLALDVPVIGLTSLHAIAASSNLNTGQALLGAKRRLPERSVWAQSFRDGHPADRPVELGTTDLATRFGAATTLAISALDEELLDDADLTGTLLIGGDDLTGLLLAAAGVEDLSDFPPVPVYARDADAALPGQAKQKAGRA